MAELSYKIKIVVAFKASGHALHETLLNNPHHFSVLSPSIVQSCDLHSGEIGTKGSVIELKYTIETEGEEQVIKEVIKEVDLEKKHLELQVIGGHFMDLYKEMVITLDVETKGDVEYVSWTLDYDLLEPENPHPLSLIDVILRFTKEVEGNLL